MISGICIDILNNDFIRKLSIGSSNYYAQCEYSKTEFSLTMVKPNPVLLKIYIWKTVIRYWFSIELARNPMPQFNRARSKSANYTISFTPASNGKYIKAFGSVVS